MEKNAAYNVILNKINEMRTNYPVLRKKTDEYVFSYRVAGICIHNNKVLLQKPTNDIAFAFLRSLRYRHLCRERKWFDTPCHELMLRIMIWNLMISWIELPVSSMRGSAIHVRRTIHELCSIHAAFGNSLRVPDTSVVGKGQQSL